MFIDDHTVRELQKHVLPVCGYTHTQSVAADITGRSSSHGYLAKQTTPAKYELTTTTNERNEKKTLTTIQVDKKKTKDSTTS